ncbi:hypothetical protein GGR50DRAFT_646338 [Xylaria sp. CBS 124048]|nr:hypothetical protein GGR50DRAFT_646338 [Xylaria sp. CBS 124048]
MSSSPIKSIEEMAAAEPSLPPPISSSGLLGSKKRTASALLPPFELSSSPGLPRPLKRPTYEAPNGLSSSFLKYPTPIATSSTGILSSSPPRVQHSGPSPVRIQTGLERAPLSAVPSLELNENGEVLFMGRSSNSSHYQLSASRHVSRIHVKARYIPAESPLEPNMVEVECNGWNGLKLHCQGRTWDLAKGDTFTSETEHADIMIDVNDARVMILWPKRNRRGSISNLSDSSWDDTPTRARIPDASADSLHSSPLRRRHIRLQSPESPTPAPKAPRDPLGLDGGVASETVQIYEDASGDEQEQPSTATPRADVSFAQTEISNSFSSDLSDPDEEINDPDEENDPIMHSFGPFGPSFSDRLAGFPSSSQPRAPEVESESEEVLSEPEAGSEYAADDASEEADELANPDINIDAIKNHVVNQLAFSRLSSNPLTAIMNNLPAEEKKELSKTGLRKIIEATKCIGVIARTGKDAAGQALESEYYYIPEHDTDESRRIAVTDGLRKPSLRACRKQHKQYFWKRPRTP